ncbi:MAG: ABC transporter permease [Acidobacteria bacterium]|nr:ABC transporter permease [Acidobacteriota bacterium]
MTSFLQDLRLAFRTLLKVPGFTLTALLTLALGIGANSAMFSALRGYLLRPLPFHQSERLVALDTVWAENPKDFAGLSGPGFFDWRRSTQTFSGMALYRAATFDLAGGSGSQEQAPENIEGALVSVDFFRVLGVNPILGRTFESQDEVKGGDPAVLLSHALWTRRFGGDPAILGRTVYVQGAPSQVVGVLPRGFHFPMGQGQDLYKPIQATADPMGHGSYEWSALARLKEGLSLEAAQAEADRHQQGERQAYPDVVEATAKLQLRPLRQALFEGEEKPLMLLMGAVALILLIACINVANLFLARGIDRSQEAAVRASLGANLAQLFRHYLAEGLWVSLGGGLLGLWMAHLTLAALPALLPVAALNAGPMALSLDRPVLLFSLGLTLAVSLVFAVAPVLQTRRLDLTRVLKEGGRSHAMARGAKVRRTLLVSQVALAVILLVGAGLLTRSFQRLVSTPLGFEPKGVTTFTLSLHSERYPSIAQQLNFHASLQERLRALPGVESVTYGSNLPALGGATRVHTHVGATDLDMRKWAHETGLLRVGPGYLETLRIPLRQGRAIASTDDARSPRVVVVNEAYVRQMFPDRQALGRRIRLTTGSDLSGVETLWEIVGVAGDFRSESMEKEPGPMVFVPAHQIGWRRMGYALRSSLSAKELAPAVQEVVRAADPMQALIKYGNHEDQIRLRLRDRRQLLLLIGCFAGLALTLATVGLYGAINYFVTSRTREIGLRMALGAQVSQVVRLVLRQGLTLVGMGLALGLLASLGGHKTLQGHLYGTAGLDPLALTGVALILGATGTLASLIPALRAARVDPAVALRSE